MKGISPLIAAVLLIAFTVAVGGIISLWLTSFSRTTTSAVQSSTEKQVKCASTVLEITSVSTSDNKVVVTNLGPQNVTLTSIVLSDGSVSNFQTSVELAAGSSYSINTTDSSVISPTIDFSAKSGLTWVKVKGLCLGEVPIEGTCNSDESCWSS